MDRVQHHARRGVQALLSLALVSSQAVAAEPVLPAGGLPRISLKNPIEPAQAGDADATFAPLLSEERGVPVWRVSETSHNRKTVFQWTGQEAVEEGAEEEIEPIATDRPDFTEASSTVGRGVLQLESGYTYLQDESDGVTLRAHSWGEALFRYGVLDDWLELRLAVFPVTQHVTGLGTTSGIEDLYLGMKLGLTEQSGWLPEMALVPQMLVPTGSHAFTNNEVLPGVNWLYGWDINDFLSTAGRTQFNKSVDDDGSSYTEFAQSWTIGYTFTEQLGGYTEWFALMPSGAVTALPENYIDGGITYKFTKDVQWDVRAGVGLNDAAADFFAGTGLSLRFR